MHYDNNRELFLNELKRFMEEVSKLKTSSINIYLGKIRRFLESGYSVADLCGAIDRLIEDYSRGGVTYDEKDHGNIKSALNQVRKMIKGDIISGLYVSYKKGSCVWARKDEHIIRYYIKNEKIAITLNSGKSLVRKIGPVNIGKLIYILQEADELGLLRDEYLEQFQKFPSLIDTPSPDTYEYNIGNSSGKSFGSLLTDSTDSRKITLQDQYDDLINQIIAPYKL